MSYTNYGVKIKLLTSTWSPDRPHLVYKSLIINHFIINNPRCHGLIIPTSVWHQTLINIEKHIYG